MCPALRNVDFARLVDEQDNQWRTDARQRLRATDQPQLGDADLVLRFYAPPMFGGGGASTWTTARRVDGVWLVRQEDHPQTGAQPAPYDPFALDFRSRRPQSPIIVREGRLPADLVNVIETALADPCFAREPDRVGAVLPLRGGRSEICHDGPPFYLQVERAEGVLTRLQGCQTRWLTGQILRVLETAGTRAEDASVINTLTPLLLVNEQGQNIPEAQAPRPVTLTLNGVSGREVVLYIAGGEHQRHDAAPDTMTWRIWPPLGGAAPDWGIGLEGCPSRVGGALPAAGTVLTIEARNCRLSVSEVAAP